MRAGTGPAPTGDGAKLRKVWESAKKSGGKFGGNGEKSYLCTVKSAFYLPMKDDLSTPAVNIAGGRGTYGRRTRNV